MFIRKFEINTFLLKGKKNVLSPKARFLYFCGKEWKEQNKKNNISEIFLQFRLLLQLATFNAIQI